MTGLDSNGLTHYIVIRKDLPLGVACAQIAHAAGESFFEYGRTDSSTGRAPAAPTSLPGLAPSPGQQGDGGSSPPRCSIDPSTTRVVILGAVGPRDLENLERRLTQRGVAHVAIREPDAPHYGEVMAIGCLPGKDIPRNVFNGYQMLRLLDGTA